MSHDWKNGPSGATPLSADRLNRLVSGKEGGVNTEQIFQAFGGYDPIGNIPNVGGEHFVGIHSGGEYSGQDWGHPIFHAAFVAERTDSAGEDRVSTVALFSGAKGEYVWGYNSFTYLSSGTETAAGIAAELDIGNLSPTTAASLFGISINVLGANVGGGKVATGAFIQTNANDSGSQLPFGIRFNAGTVQPVGTRTGVVLKATRTSGSKILKAVTPTSGYSNGWYIIGEGIPTGATIVSGAGTSEIEISAAATSSGTNGTGQLYAFEKGTGTLISGGGSNVGIGIDFASARFATAAIQLGDKECHIKLGEEVGTKIGTGKSQKIGFWGKTPIARPTGVPKTAEGIWTALNNMGLFE